jgi:hypothetical protein
MKRTVMAKFVFFFFFYWGDSGNKEKVAARAYGPGWS